MADSQSHFEVIIVGGGPAGCVSALLLSQAGIRVLLIDAQKQVSRKVCGEFLCHEGVELLRQVGLFPLVESHLFLPGRGAKIVTPSGQFVTGLFPHSSAADEGGFCLNRQLFDQALRDEAQQQGVPMAEGERVTEILREENGWALKTRSGQQFTCDLLIGADGIRSFVAQQLGLTLPLRHKRLALRCFLPTRRLNDRIIEMHLLEKGNYIGIDVVGEREVNFSVVVDQQTLKAHGDAESLIRHYYETYPVLRENMILPEVFPEVEAIAPVTHRVRSCIAPHAALIGDAGGFIEPLTGDGIAIALWTAIHLSQELIRCHGQGLWSQRNRFLASYQRKKRRHYFQKTHLSQLFYRFIHHGQFCDFLCHFLNQSPHRIQSFMGVLNNRFSPLQGLFHMLFGLNPTLEPAPKRGEAERRRKQNPSHP